MGEHSRSGMQIAGFAYPLHNGIAPPPGLIASGTGLLAVRPTEIDFVSEGGIRGEVLRKAYPGETIDYLIMVGDTEVRVQKTRHVPGPAIGDNCRLEFARPHWYPAD